MEEVEENRRVSTTRRQGALPSTPRALYKHSATHAYLLADQCRRGHHPQHSETSDFEPEFSGQVCESGEKAGKGSNLLKRML